MGPHGLDNGAGRAGAQVAETFDRRSRRDMADGPAMPRFAPQAVVGAAVAPIVERRIGTDACTDGGQLGGPFQLDRKIVVVGKRVSVRVDFGGRWTNKKKTT